ncbi:hypothetical protein TSAR_004494 [Trichomalopsis sarcophagae]|uniref:Uncharacterized protein n=1 Tax=Trichomalopsis sarcophagae TaxID=543379 RepID=A0A232ENC5_9HYME|nr:hypothetical protein TSAR_004494 [Trichomalopsis sarcophagae]
MQDHTIFVRQNHISREIRKNTACEIKFDIKDTATQNEFNYTIHISSNYKNKTPGYSQLSIPKPYSYNAKDRHTGKRDRQQYYKTRLKQNKQPRKNAAALLIPLRALRVNYT